MPPQTPPLSYRAIKGLIRAFYKEPKLLGVENIPSEPCVFVGNHSQLHGPIVSELYIPVEHKTWCAGEMMDRKEVPSYAFRDFWEEKPSYTHWFYRLLSHVIAPLSVLLFHNAETIAVYHDARCISTFKTSLKELELGKSLVIFPEYRREFNRILYDFRTRFIDLAKMYYKRSAKALSFVPMYLAPRLNTLSFGKPTAFDPTAPIEEERTRICAYLMEQITAIAQQLPLHTVIPYRNMPRSQYPTNRD